MTSITDGALALLFGEITLTNYKPETLASTAVQGKEDSPKPEPKVLRTIMLFPENYEVTVHKEHYTFFKNILKAIQISETQAERIQENNFNEGMLQPGTFCICWGTQFGSDEAKYRRINTKSGGHFLFADHLQHVSIDKDMKSKLWQQLKVVYNV